jgi:tRNA 2-thiocytidine biosynthesis protein TtcA
MRKAIHDYNMIETGDRVLVCVSGGKDSLSMLSLLSKLQQRRHRKFEMLAFILDQSQPGWDDRKLRAYLTEHTLPFEILTKDTYKVVKEKTPEGKTFCGLCSRLRRGNIYQYAKTHGFNKIALGHHRDDLIQSLLMSIMYNGQIQSMPPKLLTDDKAHVVIRPLCYIQEQDIIKYAALRQYPIIPCTLCGSQPNLARAKMKKWIAELSLQNPKIPSNMLNALQNINPSQLMDKDMWDFNTFERRS